MKKTIIVFSTNNFFKKTLKIKKTKIYFYSKKSKLNLRNLSKIKPDIVFFPYWHWKVNEKIFQKYLCIGFHTSSLPFGRGGSPVQNQIIRGIYKSQICALKFNEKIDGGPIYLRKKILFEGTANKIFLNIFSKINLMIKSIVIKIPKPKKQKGKIIIFKRRKPHQSKINFNNSLNKIYDFIRMLDLDFDNFPKAFLNLGKYKIEFKDPLLTKNQEISCKILIKKK